MSVTGAVTLKGGTVNADDVNGLKHGMTLKPSYTHGTSAATKTV